MCYENPEKKMLYFSRFNSLLREYPQVLFLIWWVILKIVLELALTIRIL